jgi:hypothetical protein
MIARIRNLAVGVAKVYVGQAETAPRFLSV